VPRSASESLGDDIRTVERNYYHLHLDYLHSAADWREREAGTDVL
jgi:hypothetical protein